METLVKIVLGKSWAGRKAGEIVEVDMDRATWLRKNEYEAKPFLSYEQEDQGLVNSIRPFETHDTTEEEEH